MTDLPAEQPGSAADLPSEVGPTPTALVDGVTSWYAENARDLPWRRPGTSPWAVLVSEVMLQQTPVRRVLPVWAEWLRRWPTPADLAADSPGEAVRVWGRLGYPRRALRLHEAAVSITAGYGGMVPSDLPALLGLPGVGAYTARAVACFAFGHRHAVVDTNVRRVLTRAVHGRAAARPSAGELADVEELLPADPARAARFSVAAMELGALVCTARAPACPRCPLREECAWKQTGRPAADGPARRSQPFSGTDRQVRGLLLGVLRGAPGSVPASALAPVWAEAGQRNRALAGLVDDGLAVALPDGSYTLPGAGPQPDARQGP